MKGIPFEEHESAYITCLLQVRLLFLQWIPWLLRMSRPGEKITRKTILMQNKMKELDMKENSSKSLLANVLDMDDDFRSSPTVLARHSVHPQECSATVKNQPRNGAAPCRSAVLERTCSQPVISGGPPSTLQSLMTSWPVLEFTGS